MSRAAVAERYGRALFELGEEAGQTKEFAAQLHELAAAYTASADLRNVLDNPQVDEKDRSAILADIAGRLNLAPLVLNAVRMMAQRHRLAALPDLARAVQRLADEKGGVLRATVTSAKLLSDSDARRISAQLERKFKRRVVLETRTDASLIAGLITCVGDQVIDGSVQGRLAALERELLATS